MKLKTAKMHLAKANKESDKKYKEWLVAGDRWRRSERKRSECLDDLMAAREKHEENQNG